MGVKNGRLIERIIAQFPTERRKLHVPEWEVDLYFAPLTKAEIEAAVPKNGAGQSNERQSLYLLVHMARDADGKPVFAERDIDALRERTDLHVLTRVEAFMWGTQLPTVKDAKAELKNAPSSGTDSSSVPS